MDRKTYELIAQETNDSIIERRLCAWTGKEFPLYQSEVSMLEKLAPMIAGKKYPIPLPTLSPKARQIRRLLRRNENTYYVAASSLSDKRMISIYAPEAGYVLYTYDERMSDQLDPLTYGTECDMTKTFAENFHALEKDFPRTGTATLDNLNSEYSTGTAYDKDCYLINSSENCENCSYRKLLQHSNNCFDSSYVYTSEWLYQCFNVDNCSHCIYTYNSSSCSNCQFCDDCVGCHYCFLSTGLRNKQYYIRNQQYTKEQRQAEMKKYNRDYATFQQHLTAFQEVRKEMIVQTMHQKNCERSYGDYLLNNKNCAFCYDVNDSEDCKHLNVGVNCKDLLDCNNMYLNPQRSYETLGTIGTYNVDWCLYVFNSSDVYYSQWCFDCNHLFGCIGLRQKEYCIFNTQYTKDKRETKVQELMDYMVQTGEYGSFRPTKYAVHPYNNSLANEYFPIHTVVSATGEKTVVNKQGIGTVYCKNDNFISEAELDLGGTERIAIMRRTKNKEINIPDNMQTIKAQDLPSDSKSITDDVLQKAVLCERTGRPFRLTSQELHFYRMMDLPLPRLHPDVRYYDRLALRQPRDLHLRTSDANGEMMVSVYPQDVPYKVYDNASYQQEMFG